MVAHTPPRRRCRVRAARGGNDLLPSACRSVRARSGAVSPPRGSPAGARHAAPPPPDRPPRDTASVGASLAVALLAIVIPAWSDLIRLVAARRVPLSLGRGDAYAVARLLFGTDGPLALIIAAAMIAGAVHLARSDASLL